MRISFCVGLLLFQAASVYGATVDKFSCEFQVEKDGAPLAQVSSFELYSPRQPTKFGPPALEGKSEDPDKAIPGFNSTTSVGVTSPAKEVEFYFSINVNFAIKKDGSEAVQSSCVGQQATFHPPSATLDFAEVDPACGGLYLDPWKQDGSPNKGWHSTTLEKGSPVFSQSLLRPASWTVKFDGHEYQLRSACKFLETIP